MEKVEAASEKVGGDIEEPLAKVKSSSSSSDKEELRQSEKHLRQKVKHLQRENERLRNEGLQRVSRAGECASCVRSPLSVPRRDVAW